MDFHKKWEMGKARTTMLILSANHLISKLEYQARLMNYCNYVSLSKHVQNERGYIKVEIVSTIWRFYGHPICNAAPFMETFAFYESLHIIKEGEVFPSAASTRAALSLPDMEIVSRRALQEPLSSFSPSFSSIIIIIVV